MNLSFHLPPLVPLSQSKPSKPHEPNTDLIKRSLVKKGVNPTPKILHALRKKQIQKHLRKSNKRTPLPEPDSDTDPSLSQLKTIKAEYRVVEDHIELKGRPWERNEALDFRGLRGEVKGRVEYLDELREVFEERDRLRWVLDDDVEEGENGGEIGVGSMRNVSEEEKIQLLVKRLNGADLSIQDWKFSKVMKQSGIIFTEIHLLKIIERLGKLGNWRLAMSVVEWVYNQKDYTHHKSRFVYTKLLSVMGKARRPNEACQIFKLMRKDGKLYPDMAAYHAIAVSLGQAGLVNELISLIECMRQKPSKKNENMKRKKWDPCLEPDNIIYNAVLNACVPCHQWEAVSWVFQQMRLSGLKPTETTYGLAMEVMLKSRKYDLVHKYFETMIRGGMALKALTYKVLVRTFREEGKVDEAIEAVRDMERRGVIGTASVYYELACCLCNKGRWRDAMVEVEKLKRLPHSKSLEVTFTGMILCSLDGGHPRDCISIFEEMKDHCVPNIGTINAMLKVYSCSDMFERARELFESIKDSYCDIDACLHDGTSLKPDAFSYTSMLHASASAQQWEYFEYIYKEMILHGFQIDQSKHTRLLVAASHAGKWHLLEHAIDSILEAGEVPRISLFTAIICHSISQQNFVRTVALVNSMAHASMLVSESQWTNIFRRHKDRLSKEKFQNLLDHLDSIRDLVMEDPVTNFIRSAKSYGHIPSNSSLLLDASRDDSAIHGSTKIGKDKTFINGDVGLQLSGDVPTSGCSKLDSNPPMGVHVHEMVDFDAISSTITENENGQPESMWEENSDSSISDLSLDLLTANIGSPLLKAPSVSDILETWKVDRMKDGIFPSQCRKIPSVDVGNTMRGEF